MSDRVRTITTVIIAVLVVAALVAPALAHAQLRSSDPANGASLPMAEQVVLTFNEDINPDFVQVEVDGPEGSVLTQDPVVEGPVVTQAVAPTLSGAHTLTYRVVSEDGHPVSGEIRFTLTEVPAAVSEPAPTQAAATPQSATLMSDPDAVATDEESGSEAGLLTAPAMWLAAGVAALVLGGLGTWLLRRRRHPAH